MAKSRKPRTVGDAHDRPRGPAERASNDEVRKRTDAWAKAVGDAVDRNIASEAKRLGKRPDDLKGIIIAMRNERLKRGRNPPMTALFEPTGPGRRPVARDEAAFAEVNAAMAKNKQLRERAATAFVANKRGLKPDTFRQQYREWKKTHR